MPRHLLDHKSQRRVRQLHCPDDLSYPEFVQGFTKMILLNEITDPVVHAMLSHLAKLSEDVTTYQWDLMRIWSNTILTDIGLGQYTWYDDAVIESERNRAAIFASANGINDNGKNTCVRYNQSKCNLQNSHGDAYIHACTFCWTTWGVENAHPLHACKKRLGQAHSAQQSRPHSAQQYSRSYKRSHNNAENSYRPGDPKNE